MTQFLSGLFQQAAGTRSYLLHVRDEKSSGTEGGTFTSGAWQTRTLNTVKTNEISGASLAANQITLPAGVYYYEIAAPAHRVDHHKAKLYNITDAVDIQLGTEKLAYTAGQTTIASIVTGKISLSKTTVLEVQHRCQTTQATEGFGSASATVPEIAVFTEAKFWKIETSAVLPVYAPLLHVEDQKASGVHAGTFTSGAWQTRTLNTVVTNSVDGASLVSNQITLPAGKYYMEGQAPSRLCQFTMLKLANITDAVDILSGSSAFSDTADAGIGQDFVGGEFTLSATKVLELQHRCSLSSPTNGFGVATGTGFTVDRETYAVVKVWKIS